MPQDTKEVNWRAYALAMCSLLDEIERAAEGLIDDHDYNIDVHRLLRSRFALAEEHGFEVEFLGPAQIGTA